MSFSINIKRKKNIQEKSYLQQQKIVTLFKKKIKIDLPDKTHKLV